MSGSNPLNNKFEGMSVDEIKQKVYDEVKDLLEKTMIGRPIEKDLIPGVQSMVVARYKTMLPQYEVVQLINPRVEGANFVWDGIELRELRE